MEHAPNRTAIVQIESRLILAKQLTPFFFCGLVSRSLRTVMCCQGMPPMCLCTPVGGDDGDNFQRFSPSRRLRASAPLRIPLLDATIFWARVSCKRHSRTRLHRLWHLFIVARRTMAACRYDQNLLNIDDFAQGVEGPILASLGPTDRTRRFRSTRFMRKTYFDPQWAVGMQRNERPVWGVPRPLDWLLLCTAMRTVASDRLRRKTSRLLRRADASHSPNSKSNPENVRYV